METLNVSASKTHRFRDVYPKVMSHYFFPSEIFRIHSEESKWSN